MNTKRSHTPEDAPHLGGHCFVTHIDRGLLTFCKEKLDIISILDIGCGPGGMVDLSIEMGFDAYGIDGDYRLEMKNPNRIVVHDFTKGKINHNRTYDLAYSCEFVEHVEEQYIENFMNSFKCCKNAVITYAPPGTPGIHHVNCRPEHYWIDVFKNFGFEYDNNISQEIRKNSTMKKHFIRNTGLFFRNTNASY